MAADRPSKLTSRLAEKRSTMIALTASAASRTSKDVSVRIASKCRFWKVRSGSQPIGQHANHPLIRENVVIMATSGGDGLR